MEALILALTEIISMISAFAYQYGIASSNTAFHHFLIIPLKSAGSRLAKWHIFVQNYAYWSDKHFELWAYKAESDDSLVTLESIAALVVQGSTWQD